MSWTVPRTWVTAEYVVASKWNTTWRDNLLTQDREIELINVAALVNNANVYGAAAGLALCSFATRTYPGFPVEVIYQSTRLTATTGVLVVGVVDGTIGNDLAFEPMVYRTGESSGTHSFVFTPPAGSHTYRLAIWSGQSDAGAQARLLEKAGP